MIRPAACLALLPLLLYAQPPSLTPAEARFQESMQNVSLTGFYSTGDSGELRADKYVIERISKAAGKLWKFEVRIQYNGKDMPIAIPVPIEWAGDTPVVTLDHLPIPGSGTFSARVLFHNGEYAGTWGRDGGHGGKLFGKIEKISKP